MRKGVYVSLTGPSLETPAETRFLKLIGADTVGMSTVSEVIAGVHSGMRVCTIVVMTNVNLPDCMQKTSIEEVVEAADTARALLSDLREKIITELPGEYFFSMSYWIRSALTSISRSTARSLGGKRTPFEYLSISPKLTFIN